MPNPMTIKTRVGLHGSLSFDLGATDFAPGSEVEITVRQPELENGGDRAENPEPFNWASYQGVLNLKEDPVAFQRRLRAEWDRPECERRDRDRMDG